MMNLLPSNHQANFPVSRVEQNFVGVSPDVNMYGAWNPCERFYRRAKDPRPQNSTCFGRYPGWQI
jgi:hypothetical protein